MGQILSTNAAVNVGFSVVVALVALVTASEAVRSLGKGPGTSNGWRTPLAACRTELNVSNKQRTYIQTADRIA